MAIIKDQELQNLDVLLCANGQHQWTRVKKKGPKPKSCPDHPKPIVVAASPEPPKAKRVPSQAMLEGRARKSREERQAKILDIIESPGATDCQCDLTPKVTNDELRNMKGCRAPWYLCPVLVRVCNVVELHRRDVE
jgi:hypothetical protein